MGTVYRAIDRRTNEPVAVKIVTAARDRARFAHEAKVLAELVHDGIVRYVAHGSHGAVDFLAMEWLEGEDLADRLAREPLTTAESLTIALATARALAHAHAHGILHRDIKPSN